MILFQQDFARFPNAIIDYDTKNNSFKKVVALYHRMGVKNCFFPLVLLNPELKGIDPHDPTLTVDQKVLIGIECRANPWYFFREVVRVPPVAGPNPIPFIASRGNMCLFWCFLANMDVALIQPRQTGKSVSTDCLMIWLIYIAASNSLINLITKDDTLRKQNVERLKRIRDYVPSYLIPLTRDDSNNQVELTCKVYGNKYNTGVAQNTESTANNLGRGLTSPINHFDEPPFINLIGTTLPAALASGNAARDEAEMYGRPYGNIFTTTAGKKDDRDGKYMYDMIHGGTSWTEHFFDCKNKKDLFEVVKKNANGGRKVIINATFSHRQLGYTDEWLQAAMSNANSFGEGADRDFFNRWTSGTQRSPLTTALNELIQKSEREFGYHSISKDSYMIRWYCDEEELEYRMATGYFVMGMDTSDAVGRDAIAGVILDVSDLSVIGAFTCNETNLIRFSGFVADILIKYPRITYIPERKSTGQTMIDGLLLRLPLAGIDPFKRIFNTIVDEHTTRVDEYRDIMIDMGRRSSNFYDIRKRHFGFVTTAATRDLLYSTVLQNAAKKAGHAVHDKVLSSEIRGLVEKNGRIDHGSSGHDDMVIAWLLAHWLVSHGKNLSFYGIDVSKIDTARILGGKVASEEEIRQREKQQRLISEIDGLLNDLHETSDDIMIAILEHRIRHLNNQVTDREDEAFSIDALIRQAGETRNMANRKLAAGQEQLDRNVIWSRQNGGYGGYGNSYRTNF